MKAKKKKLPKNIVVKGNSWFARRTITVSGKRRQVWQVCEGFETKDVLAALLKLENKISEILSNAPIIPPINPRAFKAIAEKYKKSELKPAIIANGKKVSGIKSAANLIPKVETAIAFFGEKEIDSITFGDLQEFKIARLQTPIKFKTKSRPRSIRSVNYELQTVRQILNFAIRERLLSRNPFLDGKGLIVPGAENKRFVKLSKLEEKQLFAAIDTNYNYLRMMLLLFLDAGLRYREAITLNWQRVNFETNEIIVLPEIAKNEKLRIVPISARLNFELLEFRKRTSGENLFDVKDVKRVWNKLRNKIKRPELRLHDLRHVFATRLDEKGVSIPTISKLLGHSSWKTTQIYVNPSGDSLKAAIALLD